MRVERRIYRLQKEARGQVSVEPEYVDVALIIVKNVGSHTACRGPLLMALSASPLG
jgi:hypothetical protein